MRRCLRIAVVLSVVAVAASALGCTAFDAPSGTSELTQPTAMDLKLSDMHRLAGLTGALESEGLRVEESISTPDPGLFRYSGTTHYAFSADDGLVQVYLVDTERDAAPLKARVSPDASRFGEMNVSWIGRPHVFERDGIIVLYLENRREPVVSVETDQKVLRALNSLMGEPFAVAPQ